MDRIERLDLIDRLARENAEAHERIAELERKRLEDPLSEIAVDGREIADDTGLRFGEPLEGQGAPYFHRDGGQGILYRTGPENAPAHAPAADAAAFNLFGDERDRTLSRALGFVIVHERESLRKALAARDRKIARLEKQIEAMQEKFEAAERDAIEVYSSNTERRLATIEGDNIRLKALLDADGPKPGRKTRYGDGGSDTAKAIAKLAADVVRETRDRQALFDTLESRFAELKAFVRGTVRDWSGA